MGEHGRPAGLTWLQSEIYSPELSGGFYVTLSKMGRMVFVKYEIMGQFRVRDFADGFTTPMDVVVGPDLALWVSDAGAGVIYRIGAPPE